jgi:hypothetical protein
MCQRIDRDVQRQLLAVLAQHRDEVALVEEPFELDVARLMQAADAVNLVERLVQESSGTRLCAKSPALLRCAKGILGVASQRSSASVLTSAPRRAVTADASLPIPNEPPNPDAPSEVLYPDWLAATGAR